MQDAAREARPPAEGERFIGRSVTCVEGRVVGRVRSLRVSGDGAAAYAVISLGSFSRMGNDLRAVPIALLREILHRAPSRFVLDRAEHANQRCLFGVHRPIIT